MNKGVMVEIKYNCIKLELLMINNRHLLPLLVSFLSYILLGGLDPAFCAEEELDPCSEAVKLSVQDLNNALKKMPVVTKTFQNSVFGYHGVPGVGVVQKESEIYVAQTFEVLDKESNLYMRMSTCIRKALEKK